MSDPQDLLYLSFASDAGFLGAVIVPGTTLQEGITMAHLLKVNPGGEVAGGAWPPEAPRPPAEFIGRLLSEDDIKELSAALKAKMN